MRICCMMILQVTHAGGGLTSTITQAPVLQTVPCRMYCIFPILYSANSDPIYIRYVHVVVKFSVYNSSRNALQREPVLPHRYM
jgi:hypothetical protein